MTTWILANKTALYLMKGGTDEYLSKLSHKGLDQPLAIPRDWYKREDSPGSMLIRPEVTPKRFNPPIDDAIIKFTKGKMYVLLWWDGKSYDKDGFRRCWLELHDSDRSLIDRVQCRSGVGKVQHHPFLYPTKDYSSSGEPMSEAVYTIAEEYIMSNHEPGVGYYKFALDYHPLTQPNNRSAILFHDDAGYPGSLGCCVTYPKRDSNSDGQVDWETVKRWYSKYKLQGSIWFTFWGTGYLDKQGLNLELLKGDRSKKLVVPTALGVGTIKADTAGQIVTAHQANSVYGNPLTSTELKDLNFCLATFGITTPQRIRHFLSQTAHESGGLRWLKELATGEDYENRQDLGNHKPGDGPRFKGAGVLQLTGRANYQLLANKMNDPKVMEGVEYVAATYPFTSAGVWWEANKMNTLCDRSDVTVKMVTKKVNGGYNGLDDRIQYYQIAFEVIK